MPPAKTRRTRLAAAERRQQLIEAAQKVYLELGVDAVSTLKVARAAGVSNATLYQHFSSMSELFEEAVLQPLDRILDEELLAADGRMDGLDDAARLAEMHASLGVIMQRLGIMLNAILFAKYDAGRTFYASRLQPRLEGWVNACLAAAGQPTTGRSAATAPGIVGIHLWLVMHVTYRGDGKTESLAAGIAEFLHAGLGQTLPTAARRRERGARATG